MISSRLLIAAVLCSVCAFAQENQQNTVPKPRSVSNSQEAATTVVPLGIGPLADAQPTVPRDPLARLQAGPRIELRNPDMTTTAVFIPGPVEDRFLISQDMLPVGAFCLKIRSYLMKRDSKASDSTHLAGYSTCQPAGKYRLRTTRLTPGSTQR